MKQKNFFAILGMTVAMLLASCSKDDVLQYTMNNDAEGKLVTATISVEIPGGGIQTRATADNDATAKRCLLQVLDENGGRLPGEHSKVRMKEVYDNYVYFTVTLKAGDNYTLLLWSDSKDTYEPVPDDLKAVPYENGNTIAWAGSFRVNFSSTLMTLNLSHVVARVTVRHTGTEMVTLSSTNPFTLKVPKVYTTYDVSTLSFSGESISYVYTRTDIVHVNPNNELGHFYVLVGDETQNLTMRYKGPLDNPEGTINNVPLSPNRHTILRGNVVDFGLISKRIEISSRDYWSLEGDSPF